ncbi:MAG: CBS domain-containing protein [Anaerolineaceae bacterium]
MQSVLAAKGPRLVTVSPETPIGDALKLLAEHNIGALIAVDGGRVPVGILSERDIIRSLAAGPAPTGRTVGDLMTRDVVTGSPEDDIEAVLQTMTSRHFRHLPIIDEGVLVGVVSLGDLVKALLNDYRGAVDTLETRLMTS